MDADPSPRLAAANLVIPIDFLHLVWGALLGFAVFRKTPDGYTVTGGAIIFAASTWLTWRERRATRPAARPSIFGLVNMLSVGCRQDLRSCRNGGVAWRVHPAYHAAVTNVLLEPFPVAGVDIFR